MCEAAFGLHDDCSACLQLLGFWIISSQITSVFAFWKMLHFAAVCDSRRLKFESIYCRLCINVKYQPWCGCFFSSILSLCIKNNKTTPITWLFYKVLDRISLFIFILSWFSSANALTTSACDLQLGVLKTRCSSLEDWGGTKSFNWEESAFIFHAITICISVYSVWWRCSDGP